MTQIVRLIIEVECRDVLDYGVFGKHKCTPETIIALIRSGLRSPWIPGGIKIRSVVIDRGLLRWLGSSHEK